MSARPNLYRLFAVLALCVASGLAYADPVRRWTVVQLTADVPGGGTARGVNNRGDVVGQAFVTRSNPFRVTSHAFVWHNGTREDLAGPDHTSVAWAVNDQGTIAGSIDNVATLWRDGRPASLQVAGDAIALNNHGDAVGNFWTGGAVGSGTSVPFLFRDGMVMRLPTLGGTFANIAAGINDQGIVVGSLAIPFTSDLRAVFWDNGTIHELATLGGHDSFAARIDDRGDIVGSAQAATGAFALVRWHVQDASVDRLLDHSQPGAINNRGDIVGNDQQNGAPFLLERNGRLTQLLDLPAMRAGGWESFAPMGINDRGWIVGNAFRPGVSTLGTALLLIPQD